MADNFSVVQRDYGHWDILIDGKRKFRVRGEKRRFLIWEDDAPEDRRIGWTHKPFRSDLDALHAVINHIICEMP